MTYASISDVKWWLKHPQEDTSLDKEIDEALQTIDNEINQILSEYVETPVADEGLREILGDIEAQWAAGVLRQRRIPGRDEEDIYIQVARRRLERLIDRRFKSIELA